ncbi:unnamed protein product [Dovyalis caffra]|uniref:Uncharacterized protein n=1 Tax=Dovyalis caffra TaxID=77055 RepID=A0AAV1RIZ3_9ROSI|nr:unnamed protein product [Dovyalis caffra]
MVDVEGSVLTIMVILIRMAIPRANPSVERGLLTVSATPTNSPHCHPLAVQTSLYFFNMEEGDQKELQLLPSQLSIASSSSSSSSLLLSRPMDSSLRYKSVVSDHHHHHHHQFGGPSLDLQLSISVRPIQAPSNCVLTGPICDFSDAKKDTSCVEALKWQAAEQIKLAAIEKAYAERVRDLTRKEMELAQSEFAKARHMWQRAREEVDKAERLKEKATRQMDSTCMEITCQSCRQRFKP